MRKAADGQGVMGLGGQIVIPSLSKEGTLTGNTLVMRGFASSVQALLGPLPLAKGRAQPSGMVRGPVASNGRRREEQAQERLLDDRVPVRGLRKERRARLDVGKPPPADRSLRFANDDDGGGSIRKSRGLPLSRTAPKVEMADQPSLPAERRKAAAGPLATLQGCRALAVRFTTASKKRLRIARENHEPKMACAQCQMGKVCAA